MKKKLLATLVSLTLLLAMVGSVFSLPVSADFYYTIGGYTYTVSNGEATITDYSTGSSYGGAITIPTTLGGYPVTSIRYEAFYRCTSLTSVSIPDSVTSIGARAFYYCTSLTSVTIPDSVTSIGDQAFDYCNKLTDVWYTGSETDRNAITIGFKNSCLNDATWHYNVQMVGDHLYDNVCDTTCNICGDTRTPPHVFDNACDTTCNICGDTRTPPHVFDNACDTTCNECGYIRTITHDYTDATCTEPKICTVCGATDGAALGHDYDHACDTACNRCYETRTTTTAHDYTDATCTAPKTCTGCGKTSGSALGHTYSGVCDETCNRCNEIRFTSRVHTYNNVCDKDCNVCGEVRTAPHRYSDNCDIDCNECGATRKAIHVYSGPCDSYCDVCGDYRETAHKYTNACDRDCNLCGERRSVTHKYSGKCDNDCNLCGSIRQVEAHVYARSLGKKATTSADGYYKYTCKECGYTTSKKATIYKIGHVKLSTTTYTYTGSTKKPAVTVKNSMGKTISTAHYTVTYASGRKNVGTYKVTVKFKGNYSGTKTLTFKINPAKTTLGTLTAAKKALTVKWTKKAPQISGYQIQYSTTKSFKSYKTKTVSGYKTTSVKLTGLSAKKTYYVRVRTYKTVNGKKYYSGWSTIKYKKTK